MVVAYWNFFAILLTSALICKQRLLHGNKIVKYFQNYTNAIKLPRSFWKVLQKFHEVHEKERP